MHRRKQEKLHRLPSGAFRRRLATGLLASLGLAIPLWQAAGEQLSAGADWASYHASPGGEHFSSLTQITPANVAQLQPAWRIETGPGGLQTTPLVIGGVLYALTPQQEVFAADAATGTLLWKRSLPDSNLQPVRGLSVWGTGRERRLVVGASAFLHALDPATGAYVAGFGKDGRVDLREGLGRPASEVALAITSPGAVWRDLLVVGFRTAESWPAAPGAIRAYDLRTGALRWTFHAIPRPGQAGAETWPNDAWKTAGGANDWAGVVVDQRRGIVFAPMGSGVDDFFGGARKGDNLYANTLLALDARTGRRLWHYQIVHHDVLDRDPPSPPVLLTVRRGGRMVDAVAQATKHGLLFVFDRVTGKPLFPIRELPVPQTTMPGEKTSPTQPFPILPAPYARQRLTADMLTTRTPEAHAQAAVAFAGFHSDGPFAPLRTDKQTVVFPGFDGGAEWGGQATSKGILYINANDVAWTGGLARVSATGGAEVYQQNCASCHGLDRKGAPPEFPSLVGVMQRRLESEVGGAILRGRGRMPAFTALGPKMGELMDYLRHADDQPVAGAARDAAQPDGKPPRYIFTGYRKFLDADGYPAVAPPWGTLSAIDLNTGRYLWKVPFGEYPALVKAGLPATGSENYGGPILTASGLLFIGATIHDRQLRAFDPANGKVLWQAVLPQSGIATPVTYMAGGRQFVVIGTSAARDSKAAPGSGYSAFALPLAAGK